MTTDHLAVPSPNIPPTQPPAALLLQDEPVYSVPKPIEERRKLLTPDIQTTPPSLGEQDLLDLTTPPITNTAASDLMDLEDLQTATDQAHLSTLQTTPDPFSSTLQTTPDPFSSGLTDPASQTVSDPASQAVSDPFGTKEPPTSSNPFES